MKILSYQSFSLYVNGGGSRILRRLFKGHEADVFSLAIEAGFYKPATGAIAEKIIPQLRCNSYYELRTLVNGALW